LYRRPFALAALVLLGSIALTPALALAQGSGGQVAEPQSQASSLSQFLQSQGHSLSPEETAFFDADEAIQNTYMQDIVAIALLARTDPDARTDDWRQSVGNALLLLINTDPAAAPPAPAGLQRLRDLAVSQRRHYQAAARLWLEAFQAGDPNWIDRGDEERQAGLRDLYSWQEELVTRYPLTASQR